MALSFETKKSAKERKHLLEVKNQESGASNKNKEKDHTGNIELMEWDKQALKAEVEGYDDNHKVSWRELATRYNVKSKNGRLAANGGQIVKQWLVSNNVDIGRLQYKGRTNPVIRRKKIRGAGGEISLPTEVHPEVIKRQLIEKLESGEYTIGEMIVPRKVILFY